MENQSELHPVWNQLSVSTMISSMCFSQWIYSEIGVCFSWIEFRAPPGCTQWFTGQSASVMSYNHQGGVQLSNQDENFCVRTELGNYYVRR